MVMCEGRLWPRTRVNAYQPDKKLRIRLVLRITEYPAAGASRMPHPTAWGMTRTTIHPF